MSRLILLAAALAFAGCHREPKPMTPAEGELPPLPPASGTPVGYLLDSAGRLELRPDQIAQLQTIDARLAVSNESIDTQLREIEKPEEQAPPDKRAPPGPPPNMAPGAVPMRTTPDAQNLHAARAANNQQALAQAFALLDAAQQDAARALLAERGIKPPPAKPAVAPPTQPPAEP